MLTAEILKGSSVLAELTEEQIGAIATLSKNDENAVIARKTGEIHGQYDRDIAEATGMKKPDGVKTYEWMKTSVLPKVKDSTKLATDLKEANNAKAILEQKIADGSGDETVKQQLTDANALVLTLRKDATTNKEAHVAALLKSQNANAGILINGEFDRALVGKKFKDDSVISKAVRDSFIKNAKAAVLAENKHDWIDDGTGGKTLVFRDEAGEIKRNKDNGLHPFTASELFLGKITDVLDLGKSQKGGGTKPGGGKGAESTMDISTATTQVQADELITDGLMAKGMVRGTDAYTSEFNKVRTENKVESLPLR